VVFFSKNYLPLGHADAVILPKGAGKNKKHALSEVEGTQRVLITNKYYLCYT